MIQEFMSLRFEESRKNDETISPPANVAKRKKKLDDCDGNGVIDEKANTFRNVYNEYTIMCILLYLPLYAFIGPCQYATQ